jgi:quinol-cytochrome oxidoreductase complex cytochrome b subunit
MIRPILTEFALFLVPFALYAAFLFATRADVLHPDSWSWPVIAWLSIAAFVLVIGSFLVMAQFSGAPPGSTYVPARIEGGSVTPSESR